MLATTNRIDRKGYDAACFPYCVGLPTRFDDVDMQDHVNNSAASLILQEARGHFNAANGIRGLRGDLQLLVASATIEYAGEIHHPAIIDVSVGVLSIGRSSLHMGQLGRVGDRSVLYADIVLVLADRGAAVPMPDIMRNAYARHMVVPAR